MATDTAFALGLLTCFRRQLPQSIFAFLAALAIIDDIGAIIVIAVFYTAGFQPWMLVMAVLCLGVLAVFNYAGFRRPFPYLIVGILVWVFVELAGIHGTIAGILVACLVPARPRRGPQQFIHKIRRLVRLFEKKKNAIPTVLEDEEQHAVLQEVEDITVQSTTPLQRWESKLELPVALLVLPLFALLNAGTPVNLHLLDEVFMHRVSLVILLGLVVGKPLGIMLFGQVATWLGFVSPPRDTTVWQRLGVALIAGIGFTIVDGRTSLLFKVFEKLSEFFVHFLFCFSIFFLNFSRQLVKFSINFIELVIGEL